MEIRLRTTGSLATWDHTMLLSIRHKRTQSTLTPAAGEGWYSIYLPRIATPGV